MKLKKHVQIQEFDYLVVIVAFVKQDLHLTGTGDSTNDIAHLLGMLDPWYERNTLSLLNLPINVVCQVQLEFDSYTAKPKLVQTWDISSWPKVKGEELYSSLYMHVHLNYVNE